MIEVNCVETWGFEHAVRGMRNPLNSWDKSDSLFDGKNINGEQVIVKGTMLSGLGKNDVDLMRRLYKGGTEHRKYLRQIFVSMDITAPLYWWKEFDTYKVGTVSNSCSTMHTIHKKEFSREDFSCEHLDEGSMYALDTTILTLNANREKFLETKDKSYWWNMIQLLPTSYNQKRTITMNYENVVTIIRQRMGHKLDEWNNFIAELKRLPYVNDIMEVEEND